MTKVIFADISELFEEDYNEIYLMMDPDRKKKTDLYVFERDKKLSIMSHMCLYYLIATEYAFEEKLLCREYSDNGKPFLLFFPDLHYNISHSVSRCVAGISDSAEIGLDIECIAEIDKSDFLKYIASLFEEELITVERGDDLLIKSLVLWTQKEALFKSLGTGTLKQILGRRLTKDEMSRINSYIFDGYIFSVANISETVTYLDATEIGVKKMIKYIKDWKMNGSVFDH